MTPARYCSKASRGSAIWAASIRASQAASGVPSCWAKPLSMVRTNWRRCVCVSSLGCCTKRSHTGSSHRRDWAASPPKASQWRAAPRATSVMARSDASSVLQAWATWAGSLAANTSSSASALDKLAPLVLAMARCLTNWRTVSSASAVLPCMRATRKRRRSATVRRAAPWGRRSSHCMAEPASWSSKAQRAARRKKPSCVPATSGLRSASLASWKWLSRTVRSCSAWALSAATRCNMACRRALVRTASSSPSGATCKARACSAALRERTKRPATK